MRIPYVILYYFALWKICTRHTFYTVLYTVEHYYIQYYSHARTLNTRLVNTKVWSRDRFIYLPQVYVYLNSLILARVTIPIYLFIIVLVSIISFLKNIRMLCVSVWMSLRVYCIRKVYTYLISVCCGSEVKIWYNFLQSMETPQHQHSTYYTRRAVYI